MRLFTIGYQGASLESYLRVLVSNGVGIVLDVREHAWSQRPDFVKSPLRDSLANCGIEYAHLRSVGNPSKNRKTATSAAECMSRYRTYIQERPECIVELCSYIRLADQVGRPACLTCYEAEPSDCHRSVLIESLIEVEPVIVPIHLQTSKQVEPSATAQPLKLSLLKTSFLSQSLLPF